MARVCYYVWVKKIFYIFLFFMCFHVAQAAILSDPEDAFTIIPIENPSQAKTYYGTLDRFPHTYDFAVENTLELTAVLATAEKLEESDRLSVLITKLEKRGVSEVGRVTGSAVQWNSNYDRKLALSMRKSETLAVSLESGVYRLEVSSPNNDRAYQLKLNEGSRVTYGELFTARSVFGLSNSGVLLSWKVFAPLLMIVGTGYFYKRRKKYAT